MTWKAGLAIALLALAAATLAGCAARDMDECRRGDRSRCPGEASRVPGPLSG